MTPKSQPLRPEDESERASPPPQADGSSPLAAANAGWEWDETAVGAEPHLTVDGPASSITPSETAPPHPGSALRRRRDDDALAEAITPLVTDALLVSVRRNPRVLVDALFPIILPAIRRAVAGMLRGLVQSLNQVVEQSLTVRGLRWRLEAWRTGRPVGEIALRDSLVYRVEQALLIHAENGILLQSAGDEAALDADLMSALLTAIRDFGRESFGGGGDGDFPELPAGGGRQVLVEQGPQAVLAVIVRGTPAAKLRQVMQDSLGEIQRWYPEQLVDFDGDTAAFEGCGVYLEHCLESEYRRQKQSLTPAYLSMGIAAVIVLAVAAMTLWPRWKWGKYLERLRAEPGIAVIDQGRGGGRFQAEILRDPLAADPEVYLYEAGFSQDDAELRVEPILSFHPVMIVKRAEEILKPPQGVTLAAANGALSASGAAPAVWISVFRAKAATIPGVDRFDDSRLTDETSRSLGELKREIESREIEFGIAEEETSERNDVVESWARDLRAITALLAAAGSDPARQPAVRIIGQTDQTGSERANLELSRRRARQVALALRSNGIDTVGYEVTGIGENAIEGEVSEGSRPPYRRVVIRINIEGNVAAAPNE